MSSIDDFDKRIPKEKREMYLKMRGVSSVNTTSAVSQGVDPSLPRLDLSWKEYVEDLEELSNRVGHLGSFASIYGLPPHGVIPALYLSYQLGKRLIAGAGVILELNESPEALLVVDGTSSDGISLLPYRVKSKTAVIYLEPSKLRACTPEIAVLEVSGKVKFPYEKKVGQ